MQAASLLGVLVFLTSPPAVQLTPKRIEMDAFYNGSQVRIEGVVAQGSKPVIVVRGRDAAETFSRKARAGPIWVNSGSVHISAVPSVFLCLSSEPVENLLGPDAISSHQLSEVAIRKQMLIEPREFDQDAIRSDYLKLKRAAGCYREYPEAIKIRAAGPAGVTYSVEFPWPKQAPPAAYEIHVHECRDGRVIRESRATLNVVSIGFPATMARLAKEYSSIYAVLAILIASAGGFTVDFVSARLRKRSPAAAPVAEVAKRRAAAH